MPESKLTTTASTSTSTERDGSGSRRDRRAFLVLLAVATISRVALLGTPGYDVRDYKVWAQVFFEQGIANAYSIRFSPPVPWFNYPPLHLYVLAITGAIYDALAPAGDWRDQLLAALLKVAPIVADIALGVLVYATLRRRATARVALVTSAMYLLNPAIIWNTAYWGGIDAFHAFFATSALILVTSSSAWVGPLAALAVGSKLLAVPELLALVPAWAQQRRGWTFARVAAGGALTGLLLAAPIVAAGDTGRMLAAMFNNLGNTPVVAANAHNFWWLVTRGDGWRLDTSFAIATVSYRAAGMALWVVATLFGLWRQWTRRSTFDRVMESAAYLGFAFFLFMTEVHENWSFGIFAPLALAAATSPRLGRLFVALSVTALLNMALQDPPLRDWIGRGFDENAWKLGIVNAGANVLLFAWWSVTLLRDGAPRDRPAP